MIDKLTDKQIIKNTIIINDKASAVYEISQRLEFINISYVIEPIFPHEICIFQEIDEQGKVADIRNLFDIFLNHKLNYDIVVV